MDIVELALTTYSETKASQAGSIDENAEQWREEFLGYARRCASDTLSAGAADLDWQYTPEGQLPEDVEEARALLAAGRLDYLRYRLDPDSETFAFELVQPCLACGDDRVSPVASLFHLGQLLSERETAAEGGKQAAPEQGQLAGMVALEDEARRLSGLVRRLVAQHGEGLDVQVVSLFGHQDGDVRTELHLKAASVDGAEQVAAGLGIPLTVEITSATAAYVFRRAQGVGVVEGIEVRISGYTTLPEDEAEALRAQHSVEEPSEA